VREHIMKKAILFFVFLSIVLPGSFLYANDEVSFKVIVNASNPDSELTKQEISKLFLKKVKKWKSSKEAVLPVDQVSSSPIRGKFSKEIHRRKVSSIKAYWQKQIFSGRGVPPEEKGSDKEVLEYVDKHVGAIGYVSESADLDQNEVKVLKVIEK